MGEVIPANLNNYPRIGDEPEQQKLRRTIAALDRGEATPDDLARVQDEVTEEVIREQVQAGIRLVTDGQIRWDDPITYFARSLGGVRIAGLVRFFDTNTYFRQPVVEGPIEWKGPVLVRDLRFAQSRSPVPVKAVVPGPYTLARLSVDQFYGDLSAMTMAYAEAVLHEVEELIAAGAPVVQIDEPSLVRHPDGVDSALAALSRLAEIDRPQGVKLGVLIYWGHLGERLQRLLDLPFDFYGLDFVEGSQDIDYLRNKRLDGRGLGIGLVNGRNTRLERPEELARRVREIRDLSGFQIGYLQPNCGLELLPRATARRKLEIIAEAVDLLR
ncbi:MAG: methylcobamide--CoM methyltransferase [candidate division KSB1 bacterium]|nr:methylcobamide--CoM methyltransferase [candidate division KSB1 bacterium]